jgi:RNA polymerase sigma factor for flagellar operon FliA
VSFEALATSMGLTRGRISQIHRKALNGLKDAMRAQNDCDVTW